MFTHMHTDKAAACLVFCGFFTVSQVLGDDTVSPQDWIDRMGNPKLYAEIPPGRVCWRRRLPGGISA